MDEPEARGSSVGILLALLHLQRGEGCQVNRILTIWRDDFLGREAFWKSGNLWLATAALLLPLGWVSLLLRLEPVRIRVRSSLP